MKGPADDVLSFLVFTFSLLIGLAAIFVFILLNL